MSKPFVFVLMPFRAEFAAVYRDGIQAAAMDQGVECERVDEQVISEGILQRVYAEIARADIVIADMTGCNPNVFYEVGYAHALNKATILVTKTASDIPFDLKQTQHIVYGDSLTTLRTALGKSISHHLSHGISADRSDLHVPKVRRFSTLAALYSHVVARMVRSQRVDDLSWAKAETQEKSLADRTGYHQYLQTKLQICQDRSVAFREVFTFPTKERLERALNLIDMNLYGYSVSYYPDKSDDAIPRMSFIVFDAEEVVIFFYSGGKRSARTEVRVSVAEKNLVSLFQDYYDNIFDGGILLKDANRRNDAELDRLRLYLTAMNG